MCEEISCFQSTQPHIYFRRIILAKIRYFCRVFLLQSDFWGRNTFKLEFKKLVRMLGENQDPSPPTFHILYNFIKYMRKWLFSPQLNEAENSTRLAAYDTSTWTYSWSPTGTIKEHSLLTRQTGALHVKSIITYPKLPFHQICPSDHLCNRVLHLQPGIHLHEVKILLGVHNKLHCSWSIKEKDILQNAPRMDT